MFDEHCTLYVSSSTKYQCTAHTVCSIHKPYNSMCELHSAYCTHCTHSCNGRDLRRVSVPLELCFTALTWQNTVHLSTLNPDHFILFLFFSSFIQLNSQYQNTSKPDCATSILHCYICNLYPICLINIVFMM